MAKPVGVSEPNRRCHIHGAKVEAQYRHAGRRRLFCSRWVDERKNGRVEA